MSFANVKGVLPGLKSSQLLEQWHEYEADVTGYQAPVVWKSAKGCIVTDADDNKYIDWTSGVLVTNVGHCHPKLVEAVQKAAGDLLNCYECPNTYRVEAAKRLVESLPPHLQKCFFFSTGSEATEAAIRLIKRYTGKFEIVCFEGAFHGRTYGAASAGGMAGPKRGYGPTAPGVIRAPFPNPYRDPYGWCADGPKFKSYFEHLEGVIRANTTGSLAGVIVEPYQGAAGFVFPPQGWLRRLEEWAHDFGLLITLDEVQSSYGRTGKMWAMEHEDLAPDIVTIGKAIGSGIPVSAIAARSEMFECLSKGEMSSTQGGNPVASAAVLAVFDIMEQEKLVERSARLGKYLKEKLEAVAENCTSLGDVRGRGLVIGLEFVRNRNTQKPAPEMIRPLIDTCAGKGLLVGSVGSFGNVVRVAPPLVISEEEIDESVAIMEESILEVEEMLAAKGKSES